MSLKFLYPTIICLILLLNCGAYAQKDTSALTNIAISVYSGAVLPINELKNGNSNGLPVGLVETGIQFGYNLQAHFYRRLGIRFSFLINSFAMDDESFLQYHEDAYPNYYTLKHTSTEFAEFQFSGGFSYRYKIGKFIIEPILHSGIAFSSNPEVEIFQKEKNAHTTRGILYSSTGGVGWVINPMLEFGFQLPLAIGYYTILSGYVGYYNTSYELSYNKETTLLFEDNASTEETTLSPKLESFTIGLAISLGIDYPKWLSTSNWNKSR